MQKTTIELKHKEKLKELSYSDHCKEELIREIKKLNCGADVVSKGENQGFQDFDRIISCI